MENALIVVKQLPIIEEQLQQVKDSVGKRVNAAMRLYCTEETRTEVKKVRADLNKEYQALEAQRKQVRAAILAPYEQFEALYRECVGDAYCNADAVLKGKIDDVENGIKQRRKEMLKAYFEEYRQSLDIAPDLAPFSEAGIKITLSASEKSLKRAAAAYLDSVAEDLALIGTHEHKDEVMAEYRKTRNASRAVLAVQERHRQIQVEQQRREQQAAIRAAVAASVERVADAVAQTQGVSVAPPVIAAPEPETKTESPTQNAKVYATAFRVFGTLEQLKALKQFLTDGGYRYEQL